MFSELVSSMPMAGSISATLPSAQAARSATAIAFGFVKRLSARQIASASLSASIVLGLKKLR